MLHIHKLGIIFQNILKDLDILGIGDILGSALDEAVAELRRIIFERPNPHLRRFVENGTRIIVVAVYNAVGQLGRSILIKEDSGTIDAFRLVVGDKDVVHLRRTVGKSQPTGKMVRAVVVEKQIRQPPGKMVAAHHVQSSSIEANIVGKHSPIEHHRTAVETDGTANAAIALVPENIHHPEFHVAFEKFQGPSISIIKTIIVINQIIIHLAIHHHHMGVVRTDGASVLPSPVEP